MRTYTGRCPCWHTVYSREAGQYRDVTAADCDHCGGTGYAEFLVVGNPTDVLLVNLGGAA